MRKYFRFYVSILLLCQINNAYSQLKFEDLKDLNIICQRKKFESAKTFLIDNGYSIDKFQLNFDHGSYFVLCKIEAKIKIGQLFSESIYGKDDSNIYDKLIIEFNINEIDSTLSINHNIDLKSKYPSIFIHSEKQKAISDLALKKWTGIFINDLELWKIQNKEKYDQLLKENSGTNGYVNLDYVNMIARGGYILLGEGTKVPSNKLEQIDKTEIYKYLINHDYKEKESFELEFINSNPLYGFIVDNTIGYKFEEKFEFKGIDDKNQDKEIKYYKYFVNLNTKFKK